MRAPSKESDSLTWWKNVLDGSVKRTPDDRPEAGFYKTKAWKRGPYVAAKISIQSPIDWDTAELEDDETFILEIGPKVYTDYNQIWDKMIWLEAITKRDYEWLKIQTKTIIVPHGIKTYHW